MTELTTKITALEQRLATDSKLNLASKFQLSLELEELYDQADIEFNNSQLPDQAERERICALYLSRQVKHERVAPRLSPLQTYDLKCELQRHDVKRDAQLAGVRWQVANVKSPKAKKRLEKQLNLLLTEDDHIAHKRALYNAQLSNLDALCDWISRNK